MAMAMKACVRKIGPALAAILLGDARNGRRSLAVPLPSERPAQNLSSCDHDADGQLPAKEFSPRANRITSRPP